MAAPLGFDREKTHFNIARLKKGGLNFEVVIDPDLAIKYRQQHGKDEKGNEIDIREVLKSTHIYSDAQKGMLAPENEMKKLFGTDDELEIAKKILLEGEIQLTAEYRTQLLEEKRKRIAFLISRNGIDPRTKLPHPMERILNAMEEAKVKVDMFKKAEDQVKEVVKKIAVILPIRIESVLLKVKIPAQYSGKAYNIIKSFGSTKKEEWGSNGSLFVELEIPAGLQPEFYDKINKLTHGNNEIEVENKK